MAWVVKYWRQEGCDLWEEVKSTDFFFNRMAFIYALNAAADFGDRLGESESGVYRLVAEDIKRETKSHWKNTFIFESTNRPYDGAVFQAITSFGWDLFPPTSSEAASTVKVLSKVFCEEYPINRNDTAAGLPGVLIGKTYRFMPIIFWNEKDFCSV